MESMSGRIEQTMSRHQKRQSLRQSDIPAWPNAVPMNAWVKRLAIRLLFQIVYPQTVRISRVTHGV